MSDKEVCQKCGKSDFFIVRDMTSRRICKCGESWMPPTREQQLKYENEKLKAREQKLLEVIKNTDKILRYITESNWILLRRDLDHLLFEITKARQALAKVEAMMREIGKS